MDKKILTIEEAVFKSAGLRKEGKRIVLVGGCFDILHIGHITFLEKAKEAGDVLLVFLESDGRIKKIKGGNRPINIQEDRARILASIQVVDYVILLHPDFTNMDYDLLIIQIKPAIIAITQGDLHKIHKEQQATQAGGKVIEVTDIISDQSTSRLVTLLGKDL